MAASTASEMNEESKAISAYLGSSEDDGASNQISSTTASLDRDGPSPTSIIASNAPFTDSNTIIPNDRNLLAAANQNYLMNLTLDNQSLSATPNTDMMDNADGTKAPEYPSPTRQHSTASSVLKGIPDNPSEDVSKLENESGEEGLDDDNESDHRSDAGSDSGSETSSTYEFSQEPFDAYKLKVMQLCHELGYGEPLEVERMHGGSSNRVIGLRFASGEHQHCLLRIPREPLDEDQPYEISDQVSVLSYLSQYEFLKVPSILAYDTTTNNAIGSQYVLQTLNPGKCLQMVFFDLPLQERLQITSSVAELVLKLEKIKLDRPGRLIGTRSLPASSHTPLLPAADVCLAGYREDQIQDLPMLQPQSLPRLLIALLETRKQKELDDDTSGTAKKVAAYEKLQAIVAEMEVVGMMRVYDNQNVLWHLDFCARNLLIEWVSEPSEALSKVSQSEVAKAEDTHAIASKFSRCEHSVHLSVDDGLKDGHKHSIQVRLEDSAGSNCNHKVQIKVEGNSGRTYQHSLEISQAPNSNTSKHQPPLDTASPSSMNGSSRQNEGSPGKWIISGVLDWDDALSVPLVLARAPHSWLWLDDTQRSGMWSGDRDVNPERDLTNDELLIKARFDQVMAKASPTYIEDTYLRGKWLRSLARFALHGFTDVADWRRFDKFVEEWKEYFDATGVKMEVTNDE